MAKTKKRKTSPSDPTVCPKTNMKCPRYELLQLPCSVGSCRNPELHKDFKKEKKDE